MAFYTTRNIKSYRGSAEILRLVEAFERCTLPSSEWNRTAFLTVAFWYLYLNSFPEADRLMDESLLRYAFETKSSENRFAPERVKLAAINEYIKLYKGKKTFVALANLVLRRFDGRGSRPEIGRRAAASFYATPVVSEQKREALKNR